MKYLLNLLLMHPLKAQSQKDLIKMFLQHVHAAPDAIAVMTSDTTWTYQALYLDVCAWKNRFQRLEPQTPVIICLHRTPKLMSILLALQWLKLPYIPIEPQMPLERIRAILEDSHAQIILHDTNNHETYSSLPCKIGSVADLEKADLKKIKNYKNKAITSKTLAYIIYTSGSTGTPKGVCVSRHALNHFLDSMSSYFLNKKREVLLATTTITFDIAALELFLPIWQGKALFLANQTEHKNPASIQQLLEQYPITLLQSTPSFWNMLHDVGWSGKKDLIALCGGEPLTTQTVADILPNVAALWNMYGPTEATIWCALKQIKADKPITVGRPIKQLEMWVLDSAMQPVKAGMKGELYISGVGLAEGYLNREALTKERFVFYKKALGQRVYQTGDIACMTPEGEFVILGRADNQIKLHGYRIELEDIEAHIQGCAGVHGCGVVVHQEQLIAYICKSKNTDYSEDLLCQQLARELPEFMLPKRFIYLENLPMNSSGKLNRHALPKPEQVTHYETQNLTPIQAKLMQIWCDVLKLDCLQLEDNFFELGGHSLLAARMVMKIQDSLEKAITIQDIYQAPSILELIDILETAPNVSNTSDAPKATMLSSWMPLTDFQFVLWVSHVFSPAVKKLNVVGRKRVIGPLNQAALNLALQALIQKHDALSYAIHRFVPIQKRKSKISITWLESRLLDQDELTTEAYLNQSMQNLNAHQKWSKNKPLIIAKLFYLSQSRIELQIAMPHMISDQQSLDIFFKDLSNAYLFYARKLTAAMHIEGRPFEAYARHEHHVVHSALKKDEVFWNGYLDNAKLFNFPKKHVVSKPKLKKSAHTYSSFFPIEANQLKKWRTFCIEHAVTLNDVLCAAIGAALHHTCQDDIEIPEQLFMNTVKSTRADPAFDDVIGCFLKTQTIKLDLTGEKNIRDLSKKVQQSVLETAAHQDASSLIKLSSVGQLSAVTKRIKPMFVALITNLLSQTRRQPYYLSKPILKACKRLSRLDSKHGFVVNVNIWNSFFGKHQSGADDLFGRTCEAIPEEQKDIFSINDVLDVCLFKDSAEAKAFLVLSANLKPEFREHLGNTVLELLNE
ncbi:MAG: amino acid adenylation domain-containing protein [Legionella sp.]|nr:amino acid adenylation domain-containing protein [Legionella sp.]